MSSDIRTMLKKWWRVLVSAGAPYPSSVVHMYTLAIAVGALIALVLPVRAGSGINWQCGTPDCDDSTVTFECDSPGSPRLSIEGQCPNRPNDVLNCQFLYDLVGDLGPIGKCHGPCTPNCPLLTIDGDSLVIVAGLLDDTMCTLTLSALNDKGENMSSNAVELTDCNMSVPGDVNDNILRGKTLNASGYEPAVDALTMLCPLQSLLITALAITLYI